MKGSKPAVRFAAALLVLIPAGWAALRAGGGPVPVAQPLPFSHRAHVEKEITCMYCHVHATRHRSAGLPAVESCATCHRFLPKSPHTEQVVAMAEREEQIRWNRVYRLPAFSRFSHVAHSRAGVECGSCHGDMETQEEPALMVRHSMKSCLDCHRREGASTDCLTCHL